MDAMALASSLVSTNASVTGVVVDQQRKFARVSLSAWEPKCSPIHLSHHASHRLPLHKCGAGTASSLSSPSKKHDHFTVSDFMTPRNDLVCAKISTTVDEALEMLVENRITGLPVVDETDTLVGVVSDYDLLALDSISGKRPSSNSVFPEAGSTWKAFKEIQHLLTKTHGKTVGDVMTPSPLVVREDMNIEDAARILLDKKYRRLPVVDDSQKLVGLITRGNVVRAALQVKRAGNNS